MTIAELVQQSHELASAKGWYDDEREPNIPEKLMLVVSELSEALEEYRSGAAADHRYLGHGGKPEGFVIELADAVIRIADLCGYLGLDLEGAIKAKHAYNATRPHRHGGKRC